MDNDKPVLVAITGASGAVYGIEVLKELKRLGRPAELVVSPSGERTIGLETDYTLSDVHGLARRVYAFEDVGAAPASGSFPTQAMLVAPCTIKTLSAIANSFTADLVARAADVHLKERRPLVLMVRETPLHQGHLELMLTAARLGAVIMPPVPAFYHRPASLEAMVAHTVGRALNLAGIESGLAPAWRG